MAKHWELLTIVTDPIVASLIKGRLEEENIPVITDQEAAGKVVYSFNIGPLAEIKIYVPRSKIEEARNSLNHLL
ncbi:MAG: putative signal transducing protein [Dethiobacteria bacterium]